MTDNKNTGQFNQRALAIEEMKILSSIVGRIETSIYQKQGWLFTMITGLAVVLLKDNPVLCKGQFVIISVIATVIFYIADIIQRVPVHRAIIRTKQVEKALRENQVLDSPLVSDSLSKGKDLKDLFDTGRRFRVWAPYFLIIGVIIVIYAIAP